MEKSLSRSHRQRVGTPAGRRGVRPRASLRTSRAPHRLPSRLASKAPELGSRQPRPPRGGRAPRPRSQGKSCGAQSQSSPRVKIRALTGRGARGAAARGLGASSRCAAAPGRFKPSGSQARPPAPSSPSGWTGTVPVDSPLPSPRGIWTHEGALPPPSHLPFKKIKQKIRSFSMKL